MCISPYILKSLSFMLILDTYMACLTRGNYLMKYLFSWVIYKENRIYIRGEFRQSLGMNFVSPFESAKESSKCSFHVNVHKLYAVEYSNTVSSLDYPFQFLIFLSC